VPERQSLLLVIVALCIVNGIFSPYLKVAIPIALVLMPELFPRTLEWVLFWSSVLLASATLIFSGVPAALYERVTSSPAGSAAPVWIWLAAAAALSVPAVLRAL
jgi:hypothetical protein